MTLKLLAAPLLLGVALAAQDPPPPIPTHFFAGRRLALMKLVAERTEPGETHVIMLRGSPGAPDMAGFYQDHDFYYLSGVSEPGVAMLMWPASGEVELLVRPFNRFTPSSLNSGPAAST